MIFTAQRRLKLGLWLATRASFFTEYRPRPGATVKQKRNSRVLGLVYDKRSREGACRKAHGFATLPALVRNTVLGRMRADILSTLMETIHSAQVQMTTTLRKYTHELVGKIWQSAPRITSTPAAALEITRMLTARRKRRGSGICAQRS